jgi:hypothetical protein
MDQLEGYREVLEAVPQLPSSSAKEWRLRSYDLWVIFELSVFSIANDECTGSRCLQEFCWDYLANYAAIRQGGNHMHASTCHHPTLPGHQRRPALGHMTAFRHHCAPWGRQYRQVAHRHAPPVVELTDDEDEAEGDADTDMVDNPVYDTDENMDDAE